MKTRIQTAFLALGILIWAAGSGQAATLNAAMSVGATYDLAGNTQSATSFINDGTPHIYRIDFLTTMSGLAANESFGAQSFNLTLSGSSLSRNTVNAPGADLLTPKPNYVPNNPTISNIVAAGTFTPIPTIFPGDIGDIAASTTDSGIAAIDNATVGNVVDATTHNLLPTRENRSVWARRSSWDRSI
jgi:hypothetical protein